MSLYLKNQNIKLKIFRMGISKYATSFNSLGIFSKKNHLTYFPLGVKALNLKALPDHLPVNRTIYRLSGSLTIYQTAYRMVYRMVYRLTDLTVT